MTDRDRFLRGFAERLGWKRRWPEGQYPSIHLWEDEQGNNRSLGWLVTWPAVEYLIKRARAEGWVIWEFDDQNNALCMRDGEGNQKYIDDVEEWCWRVALAVAKALFGMEGPE